MGRSMFAESGRSEIRIRESPENHTTATFSRCDDVTISCLYGIKTVMLAYQMPIYLLLGIFLYLSPEVAQAAFCTWLALLIFFRGGGR